MLFTKLNVPKYPVAKPNKLGGTPNFKDTQYNKATKPQMDTSANIENFCVTLRKIIIIWKIG